MNITISPTGRGHYDARLGDRLLCTSETPFLAAARILKTEGVPCHEPLTMTHEGSEMICLRSTVGRTAGLTVHETDRGLTIRRYKPSPFAQPLAVAEEA